MVKSTIASLRALTLPFGATTGERIVLDGVTGKIQIYDDNNILVLELSPDLFNNGTWPGMLIYDESGNWRILISPPGSPPNDFAAILLSSAAADETNPALVSIDTTTLRNRMVIAPGEQLSHGSMEWCLSTNSKTNSPLSPSLFQVVALTLDAAAPRPYIDLTGAAAPGEQQRPYVVAYDMQYGTPNATFHFLPIVEGSYPRGLVAFGSESNDVTLSTTAGTYVTIVTTGTTAVKAGRRYKCTLGGGHSLITGGSGFAVGDAWEFQIERQVDGGGWAVLPGWPVTGRVRANVAAVTRLIIPQQLGYYDPSVDADTVDFRVRATKFSGAATVTSVAGTNTGASPFTLAVEDVGWAI